MKEIVTVYGTRMMLDENDSLWLSRAKQGYIYEKFEVDLVIDILKRFEFPNIIDVGAHIGYFSCIMGYLGKVFAFEPDDNNYDLLCMNIQLNQVSVVPFHAAVTDHLGGIDLYRCSNSSGMHRVFKSKWCDTVPVRANAITLNEAIPNEYINNINFMKLDAEGSEYDVLMGSHYILLDSKPIILMEFHPDTIREFGIEPKEVLGFLKDFGYMIATLPDKKIKDFSTIIQEYDDAKGGRNLLCYHKENPIPPR